MSFLTDKMRSNRGIVYKLVYKTMKLYDKSLEKLVIYLNPYLC